MREKLSGQSITCQVQLGDYPAGMYFLRLEGAGVELAVERVIRQ